MSVLAAAARRALPKLAFAGPDRSYPIPDRNHAIAAEADAKKALDDGRMTRAEYDRIVAQAKRKLGTGA